MCEDFSIEIDEDVEAMISRLQKLIPSDDVYLYLFLMMYTTDRLFTEVFKLDSTLFIDLLVENSDFANMAQMISHKMDRVCQDVSLDDQ